MRKKLVPKRVKWIYFGALLLSLHYAFTVYINSTFLNQFYSEHDLSILYAIGSLITILCFVAIPSLVRKFGNGRVLLTGIVLKFIALVGLAVSTNPIHIAEFFLIHQAMSPLLLFGLDVFLEDALHSEAVTGRVRSMYLTVSNAAFLVSPFIVGNILQFSSYSYVFLISAVFIFLLFFVVGDEIQPVKMQTLEETSFRDTVRKIWPRKSLKLIIFLDFLLQSFYALMVVYMSIYLHQFIGFSWTTIGGLYTFMLLPFVLFEAPLGRLFDKIKIEIDTMVVGFALMCVSVLLMGSLHSTSVLVWALLLFVSRVGASFAEVGCEYSFFKRVTGRDAGFISLFRMTMPIAYVVIPLVAGFLLSYISYESLFLCFGISLLLGIYYSLKVRWVK